ncbi:MAG TPA: acetylglutamate kinase [Polyangiaceae bacterium]|jgi:acetylglutamate kinase
MIVVKIGGEIVKSGAIATLAIDLAELARSGESIIIVHGGGPQATELQKQLGQTPNIVAGRRITDAATLDVMKMTVAGLVNVDLCAALFHAGCKPVGLHGASSGAIAAKKRPPKVVAGAGPDPIDFGLVGDVTGVNRELLKALISADFMPVLACLGCDGAGQTYNINADTVANQVAVALDAQALVVVSDVPGVLRDVADPTSRIPKMTKAEADAAIASGVVTKGMIPKLEESFAAIAAGVRSVLVVGKLARGELARAVREPGSVGTALFPG